MAYQNNTGFSYDGDYTSRQREDPYNPYRNNHGFDAQMTHQMGMGAGYADQAGMRHLAANQMVREQTMNAQQANLGMANTRGFSPSAMRAAGQQNAMLQQQGNIAQRQNYQAAQAAQAQMDLQAWNERMDAINRMREADLARYTLAKEREKQEQIRGSNQRMFDAGADYDEAMGALNAALGAGGSAMSAYGSYAGGDK